MTSGVIARLLFTLGCGIASITTGADYTGMQLVRDCEALEQMIAAKEISKDPKVAFRAGICSGFVIGMLAEAKVYEMDMVRNRVTPESCPLGGSISGPGEPGQVKEVGPDQARQIVLVYLKDHPKDLNLFAVKVFRKAIAETYPCTDIAMKRTLKLYNDRVVSSWNEREQPMPTPAALP